MFITQFFDYLSYEKRYSKHTITSYRNDIAQFCQFLEIQQLDFISVSHHAIRDWVLKLFEEGLDARSVNRKISTLRSFYRFLMREELVSENPVSRIESPKTEKKLPTFIEDQKINQLLDANLFSDHFEGKRDQLIVELLFGTGIRLAELVNMKEKDLDFYGKTVKVLGKRNKERVLPLPDTLLLLLNEYIEQKKDVFSCNNSKQLIVTNKGLSAYPKFIYRVVQKYLSLITTQKKRSPHVLRHTFATTLLNNGADINAIKELLGHASLSATQIYTHNSIERIKTIYKQAHPKA